MRTLPVIALTARSDMDENYFRSHGFAGCLHKDVYKRQIYKMRKAGDNAGLLELQDTLEAQARELADKEEKFRFTPEDVYKRQRYTSVGCSGKTFMRMP